MQFRDNVTARARLVQPAQLKLAKPPTVGEARSID
jgi:hypothetical protein